MEIWWFFQQVSTNILEILMQHFVDTLDFEWANVRKSFEEI